MPQFGFEGALPYPPTATPVTATATGTTSATVATIPAVSGRTAYLAGLSISATAATTGQRPTAVVTGTISGSLNYLCGAAIDPLVGQLALNFHFPIPASATNTAIVATLGAVTGGTATAVTLYGYYV